MSDGPIAIEQRWSSNDVTTTNTSAASLPSSSSSFYFWLKAGITGLIFGLLSTHLFGYGHLLFQTGGESGGSWVFLVFLLLYTLSLLLVLSYLNSSSFLNNVSSSSFASSYYSSSPANQSSFTPSYPAGLKRLQSYLQFFPITHVINSHHPHHHGNLSSVGGSGGGTRKIILESMSSDVGVEGSSEHQQGLSFRISAQIDLAIDAIVSEYVSPWYTKISDDRSFLDQCKAIIHVVFLQIGEKLRQVDRNEFAKEAIQIIHVHWKEYSEAFGKNPRPTGDDILRSFKFVHPFLQDNKEVSWRYQNLVSKVLEELSIPDFQSRVMCQFLAGILVKNFILYYVEMLCQPSWINGTLISLLSSAGTMSVDITGSSSQNSSSPASPLPEPSPKQLNIFPDALDAVECASICPTETTESTTESTPTKKSRSSSGRSAKSGEDSAEILHDLENGGKCQHFFSDTATTTTTTTTTTSLSIDEASSASEPKTESSAMSGGGESVTTEDTSPGIEKIFQSSPHKVSSDIILTERPKDLTPLPNPSITLTTLSTALGTVIQTTAFPLLPSECYMDESVLSSVSKYCQPPTLHFPSSSKFFLKGHGQHVLEEISESDSQSQMEDCLLEIDCSSDSDIQKLSLTPMEEDDNKIDTEIMTSGPRESSSSSLSGEPSPEIKQKSTSEGGGDGVSGGGSVGGGVAVGTSHYYSFDEASKPKSSSTSFFETSTLSLDGALDQSKRQQSQDQLQLCSHEFKNHDLISNGKPNRSPVYEEPEDFAASIAKLRSLLEQKGRKSSTPPPLSATEMGGGADGGDVFESPPSSSPSTAASSVNTGGMMMMDRSSMMMISGESIPQISETCASESRGTSEPSSTASSMDNSKASSRFSFNEPIIIPSETDSTIIDPLIERTNYDSVPEIKCCFRNVTIPKVENSAEAGGQYMFYCIQYEGVYYDDKEEDKPQTLVYRTTTIKRKFKEFLTLQAHLEENAACKPHLKGIKTPTRWTNVSLTKSDATVANQRRAMLEKYLQQLCYHPIIGFCHEVMVFMAYGEDGLCSFMEVGDPKDLLSHRLDKLARKFTGVINSLKDALPSFELDLSPAPNTPKSEGITPCDLKAEVNFPPFPFQTNLPHDKIMELDPPPWSPGWSTDNPDNSKESDEKSGEISGASGTVFPEPGIDVEEGKIFSAYPLAAAVTQLLCDVLWLPQYRPHPASVATFMSISGKSLENYVVESMDIFLSDEAILGYLEWLTITVSTGGQSETGSHYEPTNDFSNEQDLKNIVKRRIPAWVRWMWGRGRLELTIDRITGLFQSPLVNHDLTMSLCELLFSKIATVEENNCEEKNNT